MNSLSWTLYGISVVSNLSWAVNFLFYVSVILSVVFVVAFFIANGCRSETAAIRGADNDRTLSWDPWVAAWMKGFKTTIPIVLVSLFVSVLIPEKRVLYAIAASEATTIVMQTDTAKELSAEGMSLTKESLSALRKYIRQLNEDDRPKSKEKDDR